MTESQQMEHAAHMMKAASEVNAATARVLCGLHGMLAANQQRERNGYASEYDESAFLELIDVEGIGHNDIITRFQL